MLGAQSGCHELCSIPVLLWDPVVGINQFCIYRTAKIRHCPEIKLAGYPVGRNLISSRISDTLTDTEYLADYPEVGYMAFDIRQAGHMDGYLLNIRHTGLTNCTQTTAIKNVLAINLKYSCPIS